MTTKQIVDKFKEAAEDHRVIKWFDFGTSEFLFDPQTDLQYPVCFLQLTDGTVTDSTTEVHNFTLYVLNSIPNREDYVKADSYSYDEILIQQRDAAKAALHDIRNKVKLENRQDMLFQEGPMVYDQDNFSGAIGWRLDLSITTDASYDVNNFPE